MGVTGPTAWAGNQPASQLAAASGLQAMLLPVVEGVAAAVPSHVALALAGLDQFAPADAPIRPPVAPRAAGRLAPLKLIKSGRVTVEIPMPALPFVRPPALRLEVRVANGRVTPVLPFSFLVPRAITDALLALVDRVTSGDVGALVSSAAGGGSPLERLRKLAPGITFSAEGVELQPGRVRLGPGEFVDIEPGTRVSISGGLDDWRIAGRLAFGGTQLSLGGLTVTGKRAGADLAARIVRRPTGRITADVSLSRLGLDGAAELRGDGGDSARIRSVQVEGGRVAALNSFELSKTGEPVGVRTTLRELDLPLLATLDGTSWTLPQGGGKKGLLTLKEAQVQGRVVVVPERLSFEGKGAVQGLRLALAGQGMDVTELQLRGAGTALLADDGGPLRLKGVHVASGSFAGELANVRWSVPVPVLHRLKGRLGQVKVSGTVDGMSLYGKSLGLRGGEVNVNGWRLSGEPLLKAARASHWVRRVFLP